MAKRRASARFLFAQIGEARAGATVESHSHPFWQLEYLTAGRAVVSLRGGDVPLARGSVLLIPPDAEHGFAYAAAGTAWLSIKFSADGFDARAAGLVRTAEAVPLADTLLQWCADGAPAAHAREPLDHLLSAMLELGARPAPRSERQPTVAERVRALIDGHEGQAWTVAGVARALRYSPGHCSAAFRAESGLPLKTYLDRARADHAARMLTYSDLGIGEIAALMGFADPFVFSRFFSRVRRRSPSAFRARARGEAPAHR